MRNSRQGVTSHGFVTGELPVHHYFFSLSSSNLLMEIFTTLYHLANREVHSLGLDFIPCLHMIIDLYYVKKLDYTDI